MDWRNGINTRGKGICHEIHGLGGKDPETVPVGVYLPPRGATATRGDKKGCFWTLRPPTRICIRWTVPGQPHAGALPARVGTTLWYRVRYILRAQILRAPVFPGSGPRLSPSAILCSVYILTSVGRQQYVKIPQKQPPK